MRRAAISALYLVLIAAMAAGAYWAMFTQFQEYDDEGYLLLTLRHFLDGHQLYGDINTQYGPLYYLIFGGLFELVGASITTDGGRLVQIAVWTLASLVVGLTAHRLTSRTALGLAATAVAFSVLRTLLAEPMHPVALVSALVAVAGAVAVVASERPRPGAYALLGLLVGATICVKINVGGLVAIAAAFAVTRWHREEHLRSGPWFAALFAATPFLLTARDVSDQDPQNLALVVTAGASALLIVTGRDGRPEGTTATRALFALISGSAATVLVCAATVLLLGVGPSDLVEGVVLRPLSQPDVFSLATGIPDTALIWAALSVVLAAVVRWTPVALTPVQEGLLRTGAGLLIWFLITTTGPIALGRGDSLGLAPLLAWVVAIKPQGIDERREHGFARIALPAIAVLQLMHVYPVAGAQSGPALLPFAAVGALSIADGIRLLAVREHSPRVASIATWALAAWAALLFVVRPAIEMQPVYADRAPLPFVGAERMRLPPEQTSTLTQVVTSLRSGGCTTVAGLPGLGSIALWAGAAVPVGLEPDGWPVQLDAKRQQVVLDRIADGPAPCGLHNQKLLDGWLQGDRLPDRPLARYLQTLPEIGAVGDYRVLGPSAVPSSVSTR